MMRKHYLNIFIALILCSFSNALFAQATTWNNPDSAKNVSKPAVPWGITNPIGNNHDSMMHAPYNVAINDSTDFLYMYDFGLNVPANATIEGVELILSRGACNAGSYFLDTASLASNGAAIGIPVTDSGGPSTAIDTLGDSTDLWYAVLTPAIVNSTSFGIFYSMRSVGICTFGLFDCKLKVHYSLPTGVKAVSTSKPILLYPNPASSEIMLSTADITAGSTYFIYDAMGRIAGSGKVNSAETKINIQALPAGMYSFRAQSSVIRFVKK